jgi:hypothetical protein
MSQGRTFLVLAVAVAVVLAAGAYESQVSQAGQASSSGSTTSTGSSTTSASTTTTTSTASTTSSFTYTPTSPVKIDSVTATVTSDQNGTRYVNFEVLFENVGTVPIFVAGGCGSGLSESVANSSVIQKVREVAPLCACAEFIMSLDQGQNHTSTDPGCWSGYRYQLLQSGSFTANLTLNWTASGQSSKGQTSISAKFDLA